VLTTLVGGCTPGDGVGSATAAAAMTGTATIAAATTVDSPVPVPTVEPAPTHRSLRSNAELDLVTPVEPTTFAGYPAAPAFTVVPQKVGLTYFPCSNCHASLPLNTQPRLLAAPHVAALPHGNGRFWCLDCHKAEDRDRLRGLKSQAVDFDDAYLVCGQCHFRQQQDWYFGAHGKRVANWRGRREIYNCTHCHDPHDPTLKPRAPQPPPKLRAGLAPMPERKPRP
jgi:hypothetical protein